MKLVFLTQRCPQKTAESSSPGNCEGASNTLFYHCLLTAQPAHRLAAAPVFSTSASRTSLLMFSLEHHLQPSASQSHSDVNARAIRYEDIDMNTLRLNLWVKFAPLHPCKHILKMSLSSGVFFAMQGHSLTGENKPRSENDDNAMLAWSFHFFSNGFIYLLEACSGSSVFMFPQRTASRHIWHRRLTPISRLGWGSSPTKMWE